MDFPAILPAPSLSGYSVSPFDQTIRTDMEAGAARVRRRSASRNATATVAWIFTDNQFSVFDYWVQNKITGGADWFNLSIPDSAGFQSIEARLIGPYKVVGRVPPSSWQISTTIEIRSRALIDSTTYAARGGV